MINGVKTPAATNPFVGPRPIETGQRIFGRDSEIEELYYLLSGERIVLLHSPSGAGKSSLIQAGLVPRLAPRFDVWGPARVNLQPPAESSVNRYVRSVMLGFEAQIPAARQRPKEQVERMNLSEYVAGRPRRRAAPENLVLIFDQFEEVLTADPLAFDAKREFFRQLGALLQDPKIWALIALREDYLAPLDPYTKEVPTHLKVRFRLDLLGQDAAKEAMAGPVQDAGRNVEPRAVDKLVSDLATVQVQQADGTFAPQSGPYVEPLHLQVVCRGLWERMPAGRMTVELSDIESFGDVNTALSSYYESEVGRIAAANDRRQRAIREWIGGKLITPEGIRGQVLRGAGKSEGLENDIIALLVNTHLIRAEQRAGAVWYELAHDRLIVPVRSNNKLWFDAHLSKLQKVATVWDAQGMPDGLLMLDADLEEAKQWAGANEAAITPLEQRFLEESKTRQAAIDLEKKRTRQLRMGLAGLAVLALIAIGAAVFAFSARSRALKAEQDALEEQRKTSRALAQASVQYGNDSMYRNQPNEALAHFSRALHADPTSIAARSWVTDMLLRRSWWIPDPLIPYDKDSEVIATSAETRRVLFYSKAKKTLQAVDTATGKPIGAALAAKSEPHRGQFSRSGKRAFVFSYDIKTAQVWDIEASRPLAGPLKHSNEFGVGFSPDGEIIVTGSEEKTIQMWDAGSGKLLRTLPKEGTSFSFSSNGQRMASATGEGNVQVWDVATGNPVGAAIQCQIESGIVDTTLSADGRRVATSSGRIMQIYDVATGRLISEQGAMGGAGAPTLGWLSADGTRAVNASHAWARLWFVDSSREVTLDHGHQAESAELSGDGRTVVTTGMDENARLWDAATGAAIGLPLHLPDVNRASLSMNGKRLMLVARKWADGGGAVQSWSQSAAVSESVQPFQQPVVNVAFSANGLRFATISNNGSVQVRDAASRKPVGGALKPKDGVEHAWLNPDGKWLVTLHTAKVDDKPQSSTATVWEVDTGRTTATIVVKHAEDGHPDALPIQEASLSTDGQRLLTTDGNLHAQIWDVKSGKAISKFESQPETFRLTPGDPSNFNELFGSISADGKRAVTGSNEWAQVWDTATGKPIGAKLPHVGQVMVTAFSPDAKMVVTGAADIRAFAQDGRIAQVWAAETGKPIGDPMKHPNPVTGAAFSADGSRVLTVSLNVVNVWEVGSGKPLGMPLRFEGVSKAVFSPDGTKVVAFGLHPPSIRTWEVLLPATNESARMFADLGETVSGYEFNEFGSLTRSGNQMQALEKARRAVSEWKAPPDGAIQFLRRVLSLQ